MIGKSCKQNKISQLASNDTRAPGTKQWSWRYWAQRDSGYPGADPGFSVRGGGGFQKFFDNQKKKKRSSTQITHILYLFKGAAGDFFNNWGLKSAQDHYFSIFLSKKS